MVYKRRPIRDTSWVSADFKRLWLVYPVKIRDDCFCKLGDTNWNLVGKRQNVNFEPLPPRATLIGLNTTLYFSDIHIVNCDTAVGSFCGWQETDYMDSPKK